MESAENRRRVATTDELDAIIRRMMDQHSVGKRQVVLPPAPEKRMLTERGLSKRQLARRKRGL